MDSFESPVIMPGLPSEFADLGSDNDPYGPVGQPPAGSSDGIVSKLFGVPQQLYIRHRWKRVVSITLNRAPLGAMLQGMLEGFSGGRWNKIQKEAGYDNFFHLCAWLRLEDGTQLTIEKLAVVSITPGRNYSSDQLAEQRHIPVTNPFTLQEMMVNAVQAAPTPGAFWTYDALRGQNCQDLITWLIRGNHQNLGDTPEDLRWYKQDIEQVAERIGPRFKGLARGMTDLGAWGTKMLDKTGIGYLPEAFANAIKVPKQMGKAVSDTFNRMAGGSASELRFYGASTGRHEPSRARPMRTYVKGAGQIRSKAMMR